MNELLTLGSATVPCPFCGTLHRVDLGRLDDGPKCGQCDRPMLLDRPQAVSDESLESVLRETTIPVLVDFYADWCGPCRRMAPVLDEVAQDRAGRLLVVKLDTSRNRATAARYGIRGIPTLALFAQGHEIARHVGAVPRPELEELLDSLVMAEAANPALPGDPRRAP